MTKEEIQRVLNLSLEYYKSEVFGTNKESEKPSSERINWIYDKMKGGSEIPNDLEEAAKKHAHCPFTDDDGNFHEDAFDVNAYHDFIAGANWKEDVSMATMDKQNSEVDLEKEIEKAHQRFPEVSFAKLSRIAKRFYKFGKNAK